MPSSSPQRFAVQSMAPLDIDRTVSFEHPVLIRGYEYWRTLSDGREMPARTDIDPRALGPDLGHLSLFNLRFDDSGGVALSPRLIGREFAEVFYNLEAAPLRDVLAPDVMERWLYLSRALLEARQPLRVTGRVQHMGKHHLYFEMLMAPLTDGGDDIRNMYLMQILEQRPLG